MAVTKTTTIDGDYTIDTYTGSGTTTWTVPPGVTGITSLVIAGGGGGGCSVTEPGGGGGAGEMREGGMSVTPGEIISIVVGAGGAGGTSASPYHGTKGENSTLRSIILIGGGYGGAGQSGVNQNGGPGGSGGGAGGILNALGGTCESGGNVGGNSSAIDGSPNGGSGGGGSGSAGVTNSTTTGGAGGAGYLWSYGGSTLYAAGGRGGDYIAPSSYGAGTTYNGYPIGGGSGYSLYTYGDYSVSSYAQLVTAMASATSGQVIFIPSSATIDMTGHAKFTVKAGVIIASDRGNGTSTGGLIKRDTAGTPLVTFDCEDNVRITGLRIQGPHLPYGIDHGEDVVAAISTTNHTGLEVDNCEISGWSYCGIVWENDSPGAYVGSAHHNYIHHCSGKDYGYGVLVVYGTVTIRGNLFDYCRHAVTAYGGTGESYDFSYNIYQSNNCVDTVTDVHAGETAGLSGRLYSLHHNTSYHSGDYFLDVAGTPSESITIYSNIIQTGTIVRNGQTRITMTDNYVNGSLSPSGPIDG